MRGKRKLGFPGLSTSVIIYPNSTFWVKMASVDSLVYTNKDVVYLRNRNIVEYDIVSGGFSVSLAEGLFPEDFAERLQGLSKKQRQIEIGLYTLEHRDFTKQLHEAFRKYVRLFREANDINDERVLSVKKDSLTFYDSPVTETSFAKGQVQFTLREKASSYIILDGKEYYLDSKSKDSKFWFKGLDSEKFGRDDMVEEVKTVLAFAEYKPKTFMFEYLKELRGCYLDRELVRGYYREMNAVAAYRLETRMQGYDVYLEEIDDRQVEELDIAYNYGKVLVPLIGTLI